MSRTLHAMHEAMVAAAPALHQHCRDAWVVIGSAAVALAGAEVEVADLDVLVSADDARRMTVLWRECQDLAYVPPAADRFRSQFARFHFPSMPVELMGGLQLREAEVWRSVQVNEIVSVSIGNIPVPIPSRADHIRILESFGRPKDLQRAALLRAL